MDFWTFAEAHPVLVTFWIIIGAAAVVGFGPLFSIRVRVRWGKAEEREGAAGSKPPQEGAG